MKGIILAAGYATRMYPLTKDRPKSLLPIGSRTVIDFIFDRLATVSDLDTVYLVTNSRFYSQFVHWWDDTRTRRDWPWRRLEVVDDGTWDNESRLGAIGDLEFVRREYQIRDEVVVSSGDNIFPFDFSEPVRYFLAVGHDVIAVNEIDDRERLKRTGVAELDAQNRVVGFEEKPQRPRSNLACPPFYVFKPSTLELVGRYLEEGNNRDAPGNFIAWLHKQVPVYAWRFRGEVLDIGHLESYARACKIMQNRAASS